MFASFPFCSSPLSLSSHLPPTSFFSHRTCLTHGSGFGPPFIKASHVWELFSFLHNQIKTFHWKPPPPTQEKKKKKDGNSWFEFLIHFPRSIRESRCKRARGLAGLAWKQLCAASPSVQVVKEKGRKMQQSERLQGRAVLRETGLNSGFKRKVSPRNSQYTHVITQKAL